MDPIVNGDYPSSMRSLVGNRLPEFSEEESSMLKGSFDFIGLNYYTSNYATHVFSRNANISSSTDSMAYLSSKFSTLFFQEFDYYAKLVRHDQNFGFNWPL